MTDIEQFRLAFEAWARDNGHPIRFNADGSYAGMNSYRWEAWVGAKKEASTKPSASLEADCKPSCGYIGADCNFPACKITIGKIGAQKDEAKDALRYRWLRDRPENPNEAVIDVAIWQNCAGESLRGQVLDRNIDAAIAAQDKAQDTK